jgi:hypothetical protein
MAISTMTSVQISLLLGLILIYLRTISTLQAATATVRPSPKVVREQLERARTRTVPLVQELLPEV